MSSGRVLVVVLLLAGALTAGASRAAGLPGWTWGSAPPLPYAHSEVAAAAVAGRIYVEGGSDPKTMSLASNEEYDPATGSWRERAPLPRALSHIGVAGLDGKLYVIGGFSDLHRDHTGAVTDVYEYSPTTNSWRRLAPLSSPRGSVGVAALDGKIYAVGGRGLDKKVVAFAEVYDPRDGRWAPIAPLPLARDHLAVVAADGRLHAIGGRTGGARDNVNRHDIYDPSTNRWTEGPPLPTARSSTAFALFENRIVVAGGECRGATRATARTFDEVEAFDPRSNAWSTLPQLPAGRHAFAAAALGPTLYFVGGALGCGGRGNTAHVLTLRGGE